MYIEYFDNMGFYHRICAEDGNIRPALEEAFVEEREALRDLNPDVHHQD